MHENTHQFTCANERKFEPNFSYTLSLSQKNFIGENLFANLFFKFEQNLHNSKFNAIAAIATFAPGCKVSANLFFRRVI